METAAAQIEALGFKRTDVRNIVLTHLDFDHAGGIEDFPHARVHVLDDELKAAKKRDSLVAIGRYSGRWLLHAGDAYFYREEMRVENPRCTPGLMAYQRLMEVDRAARLANQDYLRQLVAQRKDKVTVFSAHDMREFEEPQARQERNPPLVKRADATARAPRPLQDTTKGNERHPEM